MMYGHLSLVVLIHVEVVRVQAGLIADSLHYISYYMDLGQFYLLNIT